MASDTNNNQMESFNGNTVQHREKVIRNLKEDDSAILTGLRLYHNHVRPHLGLPDGQTPGEAAGIKIEGPNKRKAIIREAAKQKSDDRISTHLIFLPQVTNIPPRRSPK